MLSAVKWKQQQWDKHVINLILNLLLPVLYSDIFDKGDSTIQFDEYLNKAANASALMCVSLIKDQS